MKREEEKREAARKYATHDVDTDETDFYGNYIKKEDFELPEYNAFLEGCKWSDENPKSSWISIEDDLPCNHEDYIKASDKNGTFYVFALVHGFVVLSRMEKFEGEWHWTTDEPAYWMPIPKVPKEWFGIKNS